MFPSMEQAKWIVKFAFKFVDGLVCQHHAFVSRNLMSSPGHEAAGHECCQLKSLHERVLVVSLHDQLFKFLIVLKSRRNVRTGWGGLRPPVCEPAVSLAPGIVDDPNVCLRGISGGIQTFGVVHERVRVRVRVRVRPRVHRITHCACGDLGCPHRNLDEL